jgi:hypothetical protein
MLIDAKESVGKILKRLYGEVHRILPVIAVEVKLATRRLFPFVRATAGGGS